MPVSDTIYGIRGYFSGSSDGTPIVIDFPAGTIAGDWLLFCVTIWGHSPDGNMGPDPVTLGSGNKFNDNGASGGGFTRTDSNLTYRIQLDSTDISNGQVSIGNPGNTVPLPSGMIVIGCTYDDTVLAYNNVHAAFDDHVANNANQVISFVSHLYTTSGNEPTNSDMLDVQSVVWPIADGGDGLGVTSMGAYQGASSSVADWNPVGTVDSSGTFTCRCYYNYIVTPPPFHVDTGDPVSVLVTPGSPNVGKTFSGLTLGDPVSVLVTPSPGTAEVVAFTWFDIIPDTPASVLVTPGTPEWDFVGNRGFLIEFEPVSVLVTPSVSVDIEISTPPIFVTADTPVSVLVTPGTSMDVSISGSVGHTWTFDWYGEVAAAAVRDLVVSGRVVSGIGVRPLTGAVAVQTPVHYFV